MALRSEDVWDDMTKRGQNSLVREGERKGSNGEKTDCALFPRGPSGVDICMCEAAMRLETPKAGVIVDIRMDRW